MPESAAKWLRVVVPSCFAFWQIVASAREGSTGFLRVLPVPSYFLTIALVAVSSSVSFPASILMKISSISIILACASILSSAFPNQLMWVPYLSCVRPVFHILPDPFQHRILHVSKKFWEKMKQHVLAAWEKVKQPVLAAPEKVCKWLASSSSSRLPANSSFESIRVDPLETVPEADASTSSPSSSTPTSVQPERGVRSNPLTP